MKILNLYCGIGGNAKSFQGHEVTAVEYNPQIAAIYKEHFPDHTVIVGDAVDYLINHFNEFDMIWASPPCPTHSRVRKSLAIKKRSDGSTFVQNKPVLPDMTLYGIIIFLQHYFNGIYVVENVLPYYDPLLPAYKIGRHLFWSNVDLSNIKVEKVKGFSDTWIDLAEIKGFDLSHVKGLDKRLLLRNAVDYRISNAIMERIEKSCQK